MDYSIHDAIEAGFNKIVFIIRKDIENAFHEVIGDRIEAVCSKCGVQVAYAFQELCNLPDGIEVPDGRTKPWGTGQAVLCCKDLIHEPFAVINADDYYGKESFRKVYKHLANIENPDNADLCMAGYVLANTLSDNGGVTRGICITEDGFLRSVVETKNIVKSDGGASADGKQLNTDSIVSMNMWGLTPKLVQILDGGFQKFLTYLTEENQKTAEFLLPVFIGELVAQRCMDVRVLPTSEKWFGVTYAEDKPVVVSAIQALIDDGVYSKDLFSDL